MHVVHVLPFHFGARLDDIDDLQTRGGGERGVFQLAKAMARYADTTIVTFGADRRSHLWHGVRIEIYPARAFLPRFNGNCMPFSVRFLHELRRADVVQCHQIHSDTTLIAVAAARALRKPVFATDHGFRGLGLTRLPFIPLLVDELFAESRFGLRQYPHARRSRIIGAGVDIGDFPYSRDKDGSILLVARISAHKGTNYLVEAVEPDMSLTVMGRAMDAGYLDHLRRLAEGKHVRFVVDAPEEHVHEAYRRASIVVLPSVYRDMYGKYGPRPELFGLAVAEGMASGAACVATDVGALPEVVEDGVTGYIVPPNDPAELRARLRELVDTPDRAAEMGRKGRERVERLFTWDAAARRCIAAYEERLRGRRVGADAPTSSATDDDVAESRVDAAAT